MSGVWMVEGGRKGEGEVLWGVGVYRIVLVVGIRMT